MNKLSQNIISNYQATKQLTVVHIYLSAGANQTRLDKQDQIEVKFLCGRWF